MFSSHFQLDGERVSTLDKINRKNFLKLRDRSYDLAHKLWWRVRGGGAGNTMPVFIFGAQRSGTTMLGECFGRSPEIMNLGESDPRAFESYSLLDIKTVEKVIEDNPYNFLIFKPLKDGHRANELLEHWPEAKSLWAYRDYADRVNSAVERFGRHPLDVFSNYVSNGSIAWQLESLSAEDSQLLKTMNIERLSVNDGAALMWYIRNRLFYNLGLDQNSRVRLFQYEAFVSNPSIEMKSISEYVGCHFTGKMVENVHSKSLGKRKRPEIASDIENLCEGLREQLDESYRKQCAESTNEEEKDQV